MKANKVAVVNENSDVNDEDEAEAEEEAEEDDRTMQREIMSRFFCVSGDYLDRFIVLFLLFSLDYFRSMTKKWSKRNYM